MEEKPYNAAPEFGAILRALASLVRSGHRKSRSIFLAAYSDRTLRCIHACAIHGAKLVEDQYYPQHFGYVDGHLIARFGELEPVKGGTVRNEWVELMLLLDKEKAADALDRISRHATGKDDDPLHQWYVNQLTSWHP